MNPAESYERLMGLFDQARELSAHARAEFVQRACGDDADLRRELESLLKHDEQPIDMMQRLSCGNGMQVLAGHLAASDAQGNLEAGKLAQSGGCYRIIRLIAEGGMGAVYEAEQENPRRTVALKVIRELSASDSFARRLRQEAHLLGRLHHPGIATIYDAGTTDIILPDGRTERQPFFAMELIRGHGLDEYVRRLNLPSGEILQLVARVCDAVHYAHEQGIVHRDLKPGNILVDAQGHPKVLDFGVARTTNEDWNIATLQTQPGQLVGTLPYMSPEQVAGGPVDRRCDVYALGVILYKLLTGSMPYQLQDRQLHEAVRIIQEVEPTQLSSINRSYRGDIDTIVAKALEKDAARRYQTVGELAADIRRHLANQPVLARPATTLYQIRKFARRNKVLVGSALSIFAALVLGSVIAITAGLRAVKSRDEAQRSSNLANAVNQFLTEDLLDAADPTAGARHDAKIIDAVRAALPRIDARFKDAPEAAAELHGITAKLLMRLADYDTAASQANRAIALHTQLTGHQSEKALSARILLGEIRETTGKLDEARSIFNAVLNDIDKNVAINPLIRADALGGLASVHYARRELEKALQLSQEAYAIYERSLGSDHPATFRRLDAIGSALYNLGRREETARIFQRLYEAELQISGLENARTAARQHNFAVVLLKLGRLEESEPLFQSCLDVRQRLLGESHPDVADTLYQYARAMMAREQWNEALQMGKNALKIQRAAYGDLHESVPRSLNLIATVLKNQHLHAEAEPYYRESDALYAATRGVKSTAYAISRMNIGMNLHEQNRCSEALPYLKEAFALSQAAFDADSDELVNANTVLGRCLVCLMRYSEATPYLQTVLEINARKKVNGDTLKMCRDLLERSASEGVAR